MSSEYLNNKFFEKIICEFQDSKREINKIENNGYLDNYVMYDNELRNINDLKSFL